MYGRQKTSTDHSKHTPLCIVLTRSSLPVGSLLPLRLLLQLLGRAHTTRLQQCDSRRKTAEGPWFGSSKQQTIPHYSSRRVGDKERNSRRRHDCFYSRPERNNTNRMREPEHAQSCREMSVCGGSKHCVVALNTENAERVYLFIIAALSMRL